MNANYTPDIGGQAPLKTRRSHRWLVISLTVAAVFLVACAAKPAGKQIQPANPGVATTSETRYDTPVAANFSLKLTELSKQCFGSAGCNITFSVELQRVKAISLDPAKTYRLLYSVAGPDEPYSNYLTIQGDTYTHADSEFVSTKDKKVTLVATITGISEA